MNGLPLAGMGLHGWNSMEMHGGVCKRFDGDAWRCMGAHGDARLCWVVVHDLARDGWMFV